MSSPKFTTHLSLFNSLSHSLSHTHTLSPSFRLPSYMQIPYFGSLFLFYFHPKISHATSFAFAFAFAFARIIFRRLAIIILDIKTTINLIFESEFVFYFCSCNFLICSECNFTTHTRVEFFKERVLIHFAVARRRR